MQEIPAWMWICGVGFDKRGVTFHGFRPVIRDESYGFVCWNISTTFILAFKTEDTHTTERIGLLKALVWTWAHASDLSKKLAKPRKLPLQFKLLGNAWDVDIPESLIKARKMKHKELLEADRKAKAEEASKLKEETKRKTDDKRKKEKETKEKAVTEGTFGKGHRRTTDRP